MTICSQTSFMNSKFKNFFEEEIAVPVLIFSRKIFTRFRVLKTAIKKWRAAIFFGIGTDKSGTLESGAVSRIEFFRFKPRMAGNEQIVFIRRLAIMAKAGVSIVVALDILKKQAVSEESKKIIGHLRECVEKGQPLARAMEKYRNVFGNFGINIVLVGETSGTLAQNLDYLAAELNKKQELRRAIIAALIYPAFIAAATIAIVIMLIVYVFPKILPIFSSFKAELPWTTKMIVAVSGAVQAYWPYYLAGIFFFAGICVLLLRKEAPRRAADRMILRVPLLGKMFRGYFIANFTRTFSLLLKSEIGIVQALKIVGDTAGNLAYKEAFKKIAEGVVGGGSAAENMEKDKLLFPPLVSQMVGVGEMTGNLGSSLMYLSEMYEDEMNNSTKNLASSIEPALMIFMGVLVGFIAISIISPIYGITQSLH